LSAGEKTRVGLVKSMLNDPELILMDEPTASLDPDIADKTLSLVEDLRRSRGLSILFTSHNMAEVERVCDQVAFLSKGRIVSIETPAGHTKRFKEVELLLTFKGAKRDVENQLKKINLKQNYDFNSADTILIKTSKDKVAETISAVNSAGIVLVDVELRRPDLEDVFLEIARGE
jgi:ABC-2 type transport system ATP-binding protein